MAHHAFGSENPLSYHGDESERFAFASIHQILRLTLSGLNCMKFCHQQGIQFV